MMVSGQTNILGCPDNNHPHMVDLGLPSGTRWACCNVGATTPEGYGGYYAWGEIVGTSYYSYATYSHCDGSQDTCHDLGSNIAGTKYDVANVNWGGFWEMPTNDQNLELLDNCNQEWTTVNGVNGMKFTSKTNGVSIFLPAAGSRRYGALDMAGSSGYYWSSTQHPSYSYRAYILYFDSGDEFGYYFTRYCGLTVRPVAIIAPFLLSEGNAEIGMYDNCIVQITSGNGSYTAASSDENVATATIDGSSVIITAVAVGTATITVTDTRIGESDTIEVTVYPPLALSESTLTTIIGDDDIIVRLTGGSGTYTVTNSNQNVVTATFQEFENGGNIQLHAISAGTATITVTDNKTGDKVSIEETVFKPLELDKTILSLYHIQDKVWVKITSGNGSYTVKSSNSNVATATIEGNTVRITAIKNGYATITVTDTQTARTASVAVTVIDHSIDPLTPSSPYPSNGAVDVGTSGTFVWLIPSFNGGKGTPYELYLDTDENFSNTNGRPYHSDIGNSCSFSGLQPGKKYYWKVKVYSEKGQYAISEVWSFTTKENKPVVASLRGDVNGDSQVTIADVMTMVDYILANVASADFIASNADLNGDKNINITDVMIVVQIILYGETADPYLVVWHKDGSKIMFMLDEKPKITYLGEQVTIKGNTMVECEFQAIRKMTFEQASASSSILALPFVNDGETVTFLPADKDLLVRVTLTDGRLVKDFVVKKGEMATLPLDGLKANAYRMDVNGVTYKIKTK